MENNQILLETKLVSDIKGTFYVPSYVDIQHQELL